MEWVLRIMANLMRPDELGPAEAAYRAWRRSSGSYPRDRDMPRGADRHVAPGGSDSLRFVPGRGAHAQVSTQVSG